MADPSAASPIFPSLKPWSAFTPKAPGPGAKTVKQTPLKAYADDGLGKPSWWTFSIQDQAGKPVGLPVDLRFAPQNVEIQRPMRIQVSQDLGRNAVTVQDGLGIAKWSLSGTHGAGVNPSGIVANPTYGQLSAGLDARYRLLDLFESFANLNVAQAQGGGALYSMILTIHGGGPAEMSWDQWEIMPEEAPRDRRNVSGPLAWNWSLSFWGIKHLVADDPDGPRADWVIQDELAVTSKALAQATKKLNILQQFSQYARQIQQFVSQVQGLTNAITSAVAQSEDIANGVLNLALLVSQTASSLLTSMKTSFTNEKDYVSSEARSFRDSVIQIKLLAGALARTVLRPNALVSSLAYSPSRPLAVPVMQGDNLQSIAARTLGDPTQWPVLVALNNLIYPYLDFSGPGGSADPALQGSGVAVSTNPSDPLFLPAGAPLGLGGRVFGVGDILVLPLAGGSQTPPDPIGWDTNEDGSMVVMQGRANLVAALLRRLRTPAGWLPYHQDYGAGLGNYVGGTLDVSSILALRRDVANSLQADPRVIKVLSVAATVSGDAIFVSAEVQTPLGPLQVAGNLNPGQTPATTQTLG